MKITDKTGCVKERELQVGDVVKVRRNCLDGSKSEPLEDLFLQDYDLLLVADAEIVLRNKEGLPQ